MHTANLRRLVIDGRFTRRGGIDINPIRSNKPVAVRNERMIYQ